MSTVIQSWPADRAQAAKSFCERFLQAEPESRLLFGCNVYSEAVAKGLDVAGFVESAPTRRTYAGLPVYSLEAVQSDALVVSCAGGRLFSASAALKERGVEHIDYFAFKTFSGQPLPDAVFNEDGPSTIEANQESIEWLEDVFADDESRKILRKLVAFRRSYDIHHLRGFSERQSEQYFEEFLALDAPDAVFVDVGCYDGFTSLEFARRVPRYSDIIALEPDTANFERCQNNLAHLGNVTLLAAAAGSASGRASIVGGGSTASLSLDGDHLIEVSKLDDLIKNKATFIKLDIEGAELDALQGARKLIQNYNPTLAICVYHRPDHFWKVPKLVLSINPDYLVFLRHYTESIYETVMYFVPRGVAA